MNNFPNKSLTISGKYYSESELMDFAKQQVSSNSILSWEANLYEFILDWVSDFPVLKVKTSGSTGTAKWMKVEKERMIKSAQLTGQFFNLQKNDTALLCLPVNFIAGKMMVVRAFVLGLNLIPVEPSGSPLKNLNKLFEFAAMTPMQVYNTLNLDSGFQKLDRIKNLIIGGGEISQALLKEVRKLENSTFHTYGMTETFTHVAIKKLNGKNPDLNFVALPGIEFFKDKYECLVISAPTLSEKYFTTNDIVDLKDEKTFQFIGRFDNIINSGGIKVSPELIEQKLHSYLKERFIVAGIPDNQLGQKLVLIIEKYDELQVDFANIGLTKYEIPKQVFFLPQFPETDSGKIIRHQVLKSVMKKT